MSDDLTAKRLENQLAAIRKDLEDLRRAAGEHLLEQARLDVLRVSQIQGIERELEECRRQGAALRERAVELSHKFMTARNSAIEEAVGVAEKLVPRDGVTDAYPFLQLIQDLGELKGMPPAPDVPWRQIEEEDT